MAARENRQMKNQDLKKFRDSSFRVKSNCAISVLTAKLEIANAELALVLGREDRKSVV